MSSINGTSALRVNVALSEHDAVKLILDFLQQRELYISMLDIERETGINEKAIRLICIWFDSFDNDIWLFVFARYY
jgi:hypothetical protein